MRITVGIGLLLACCSITHAQTPHIVGTWKLNVEASRLLEPAPQMHVRRYSLAADGSTLIGLAVVVNARGNPSFLQFAAKADGKDYAEFDSSSLAELQMDGTRARRTYAETPVDSHTVNWVDKSDGRVIASGKKWVSADGQTLSFTSESRNNNGEPVEYLWVFDRTGP